MISSRSRRGPTPNSIAEVFQFAQDLARSKNIKTFKGMSASDSPFFKIFFFIDPTQEVRVDDPKAGKNGRDSLLASGFNRPAKRHDAKPDSEYLILNVFSGSNRVQVEDSNVKKTLEAKIVGDVDTRREGEIMSVETQMKALVGQWLKLCRQV